MFTSTGLVTYAKSCVGEAYMKGCQGWIITEAVIQRLKAQYPKTYTDLYVAKCRKNIGKRGFDCTSMSDVYCGVDYDQDGWLLRATDKGDLNYSIHDLPIQKIPEIPGLHVHKVGHMGIYKGNGIVIEARGIDYGVVETKIETRGWTHWAKNFLVSYEGDDMELRKGVKGQQVYSYQIICKKLGGAIGAFDDMVLKDLNGSPLPTGCDGSFGQIMVDVTNAFQRKYGLPVTVDGYVTDTLYGRLNLELQKLITGVPQAQYDAVVKANNDLKIINSDLAQKNVEYAKDLVVVTDERDSYLADLLKYSDCVSGLKELDAKY